MLLPCKHVYNGEGYVFIGVCPSVRGRERLGGEVNSMRLYFHRCLSFCPREREMGGGGKFHEVIFSQVSVLLSEGEGAGGEVNSMRLCFHRCLSFCPREREMGGGGKFHDACNTQ